jgi:hypothetical protein
VAVTGGVIVLAAGVCLQVGLVSGQSLGAQALEVPGHGGLVVLVGLALLHGDGSLGTLAQAGAQAVAQVLGQQSRFAIYQSNGPLGAGGDALTATVALLLVDCDDLPQCHGISFRCSLSVREDGSPARQAP